MSEYSIFDVAGPIMIGPSSSHTAGACKIGQYARALFNKTPSKVTFYLHGSFGEVYKGHATDKALLAGVLKFRTSDPRMKDSEAIAQEKKINYKFIVKDLGPQYHPNSVRIDLEKGKHKMSIIGSSIGGGVIEIVKIDNFVLKLRGVAGKFLSLIIKHDNDPKIIPLLISKLKKLLTGVLDVESVAYKDKLLSVLSTEGHRLTVTQVLELEKTKGVDFIRALSKLDK